jgi:hypothetical protein
MSKKEDQNAPTKADNKIMAIAALLGGIGTLLAGIAALIAVIK